MSKLPFQRDENLISSDWLIEKGFKLEKKAFYELWRRANEDGFYFDYLVLHRSEIASFYKLGIDMGKNLQNIMQNEAKIFYKDQFVKLYFLLTEFDLDPKIQK